MTDFIGDIHGYADKLEALLQKMEYVKKNGFYCHSERKVIFLGDYIDRGPKIRETLEIVRAMVENGQAIALMGNHEYNALCFHHQENGGGHLRPHLIKNIIQHFETLSQFKNRQSEYENYLEWFKTMPVYYETKEFRAIHACWERRQVDYLKSVLNNGKMDESLLYRSVNQDTNLNEAIEIALKGKEMVLPEGICFEDTDGSMRYQVRIKWWENPAFIKFSEISLENPEILPSTLVPPIGTHRDEYYKEDEKPVFFGHYCLKGIPSLFRNNICCTDYGVAKAGHLVAYRYYGEIKLENSNFVYV